MQNVKLKMKKLSAAGNLHLCPCSSGASSGSVLKVLPGAGIFNFSF